MTTTDHEALRLADTDNPTMEGAEQSGHGEVEQAAGEGANLRSTPAATLAEPTVRLPVSYAARIERERELAVAVVEMARPLALNGSIAAARLRDALRAFDEGRG